jgi:molybdopterin-biosynthesis enzyme MoeA-like protein
MGVAQNALLGAGAAIGVSASKLATGLKSMISEANDAEKAKAAKDRAKKNKEAAIKNRKEQKAQQDQVLKKKEKEVKSVLQGSNTDTKTRVNVMQELRER